MFANKESGMTAKRAGLRIIDILFWGLVIILAILYLVIHISEKVIPAIKGLEWLVFVHFAAIFVFPILLRFKGVRLLPRILFMMIGFPAFGLSLVYVATWFLGNYGLCTEGNGYAPLSGFWLFVPYFPLASCVVIVDIIFTYLKYLWRKRKSKTKIMDGSL